MLVNNNIGDNYMEANIMVDEEKPTEEERKKEEENVYSDEKREALLEDEEIDPSEYGFMEGYEDNFEEG